MSGEIADEIKLKTGTSATVALKGSGNGRLCMELYNR